VKKCGVFEKTEDESQPEVATSRRQNAGRVCAFFRRISEPESLES
jgi:hypothetical protein